MKLARKIGNAVRSVFDRNHRALLIYEKAREGITHHLDRAMKYAKIDVRYSTTDEATEAFNIWQTAESKLRGIGGSREFVDRLESHYFSLYNQINEITKRNTEGEDELDDEARLAILELGEIK